MPAIRDWLIMSVSGRTRASARNLSSLTDMPSGPDECLVCSESIIFFFYYYCSSLLRVKLNEVSIFWLRHFRNCLFWFISIFFVRFGPIFMKNLLNVSTIFLVSRIRFPSFMIVFMQLYNLLFFDMISLMVSQTRRILFLFLSNSLL